MDTKKLSFFIIAVGVILVALETGHWRMAENEAEHRGDFRKEMRATEMDRLQRGNGEDLLRYYKLKIEMLKEARDEIEMATLGYKLKVDHTISYSLMIGGVLVIIMGVGMRISSSKKPDTAEIA